jgi:hypothetical protein
VREAMALLDAQDHTPPGRAPAVSSLAAATPAAGGGPPPPSGLFAAKRALDTAAAILLRLAGGGGAAPREVMVTGLGRDAREEDVRLFLQGGGGGGGGPGVQRVSVRDDGDFLHPAHRHLVAASAAAAAGQNRLAFVTLRDDAALAAALARDGAEASPGRRLTVRALRAQEAGRQATDGPRASVEDIVRVGRLRTAHRAVEERLQRQLQALEVAAKAAVDAAEAAMADCDVEMARDSLARAEAAIGALPPGDELGVSQVDFTSFTFPSSCLAVLPYCSWRV